jgi:hypothetical protein
MAADRFDKLLGSLRRLEEAKIYHRVVSNRYDAISVVVTVPGQRWEVDFLADGDIDVERFVSTGDIDDESALEELFEKFSEPPQPATPRANPNGVVTH